MQVDKRHHDEGEGGRGQARRPVMHAEVLEDEHRAPVIERGLFQPGLAVEVGSDAGAQLALQRWPYAVDIPLAAAPGNTVAQFALQSRS